MNALIAVVDDEPDILELVALHLKKNGFQVKTYEDPTKFLSSLDNDKIDLAVLDLMMPNKDGLEVCRDIRANRRHKDLPIIMLTAKGEEMDRVLGLELGADDYLTKPFSPRELVARVKSLLRRCERNVESASVIRVNGDLEIDCDKHLVTYKGNPIEMTSTEFKILRLLAENVGNVFSRERILNHLWGEEKAVLDRTVDVHVKNLREKLGQAADYIQNIRGVGYKLKE